MEFSFHFLVFYVTPNSRLWAIYPFKGIPVGKRWGKLKRMLVNRPGVARAALQSQSETMSHVSHVPCHVSHVTCHLSRVTCPLSHVSFLFYFFLFKKKNILKKIWQSCGASWWRVCYQRGLPRLVFSAMSLQLRWNNFFATYATQKNIKKCYPVLVEQMRKTYTFVIWVPCLSNCR